MTTAKERTLFHGTSTKALENILKAGLLPKAGEGADAWAKAQMGLDFTDGKPHVVSAEKRKNSVYVTDNEYHAAMFARYAARVTKTEPVVLKIVVPPGGVKPRAIRRDEYSASPDDHRFEGAIPPEWITVKAKGTEVAPPMTDFGQLLNFLMGGLR